MHAASPRILAFRPSPVRPSPFRVSRASALNDAGPLDEHLLQGPSPAIAAMWAQIHRVADHFRAVLLLAKPGSGAEAVARSLYALAPRRAHSAAHSAAQSAAQSAAAQPFVVLDAEAAEIQLSPAAALSVEGFLFLAEADRLSPQAQRGLTRRMRQRDRPLRIAAASATDLRAAVSAGQFEPMLAEALSAVRVNIPALADRADDVPMLVHAMLERICATQQRSIPSVPPEFIAALRATPLPRNLDDLRALLTAAVETSDTHALTLADFNRGLATLVPASSAAEAPTRMVRLDTVVHEHVLAVLVGCGGNKLRAADVLGISRSTLYRMLDAGPSLSLAS